MIDGETFDGLYRPTFLMRKLCTKINLLAIHIFELLSSLYRWQRDFPWMDFAQNLIETTDYAQRQHTKFEPHSYNSFWVIVFKDKHNSQTMFFGLREVWKVEIAQNRIFLRLQYCLFIYFLYQKVKLGIYYGIHGSVTCLRCRGGPRGVGRKSAFIIS